jgi:hypothetical protein
MCWDVSRVRDKENFSRDMIIKADKTTLSLWFKRMEIVVLSKKKNVKKQGEWRHGHDHDVPCPLWCREDKAILSTEEGSGQHHVVAGNVKTEKMVLSTICCFVAVGNKGYVHCYGGGEVVFVIKTPPPETDQDTTWPILVCDGSVMTEQGTFG